MKNWKTTVFGAATIIAAIASAIKAAVDGDPTTLPDWAMVVAAVITGIGLIAAKDSNVTGGTKQQ